MKITAQQVNELRKSTGAGMMDCKKALVETEGDMEKAIDVLRKKGQKVAAKRADRDATEGVVLSKVSADKTYAAVVMVNCETDFVAKNSDFIGFTQSILDVAISNKAKTADDLNNMDLNGRKVEELILDQTGVIGEKIQLGHFEIIEAESVYSYIHPGNRIATIAGFNKSGDNLADAGKDIVMQIAAMDPVSLSKDDVSEDVIKREIEIGMDQARQEGKPEEMLEKIATGKLNKFYKENTLLNQSFIKDNKMSVSQYLSNVEGDLTITGFKRLALA
ncbi:MAG: elongation factor Ts [Lentimicrobiaceae bacterium]|jgi:elongation factor Ts|nr:elongation factor Ts [Lentimicrobiaceae bacterium]MDG1135646.1 translation elongation factor Ts [Bacteroidales bacterium]MBT3175102.1 elongation factor Ts [Lentimicrobiaceae bacterium]MBT3453503.1 elongation factor Ts [Lentimicrobiaceae bacterium]MBT3818004.1 elongation factor Ts [Lentimicrobiaceae bacterium]|tara:strand:+ start:9435 stop:10262 length:828 start_codon:yes stop_codon:yes gene_type:complete